MVSRMNENAPSVEAREQAEVWHARLMAPDCSKREQEAFEQWRAQSGHAEAFAATERLLAGVDALAGSDPRMEFLMQRARRRPAASARKPRHWRIWAAAACVALVVALGLRFGPALLNGPAPVQYATEGQVKTITLEDGSNIRLDVASRIAVSLGKKRRSVELLEGRAVFDVAHDAARPFVVQAGDGSITDVGTRFQVQREGDDVVVTLAKGIVEVSRQDGQGGDQETRLRPGEQVRWSGKNAGWTLRPVDTEAALSWTRGRLIFRGTPLANVVAEVNRYSTRKLVLADPSLADLSVHGNFLAGDAGAVVTALKAVLPVRVDETGREIRLYRR
jgi:transmembrane sensor